MGSISNIPSLSIVEVLILIATVYRGGWIPSLGMADPEVIREYDIIFPMLECKRSTSLRSTTRTQDSSDLSTCNTYSVS